MGQMTLLGVGTPVAVVGGGTPAWVMVDSASTAAVMDLDFDNDRYWYGGTEYLSFAAWYGASGFTHPSTTFNADGLDLSMGFGGGRMYKTGAFAGYSSSASTFILKVKAALNTNAPGGILLGDDGVDRRLQQQSSSATQTWLDTPLMTATTGGNSWGATSIVKVGFAFATGVGTSLCMCNGTVATNGTAAASFTGGLVIAAGQNDTTQRAAGTYMRVTYFAKKISDADLLSLTT